MHLPVDPFEDVPRQPFSHKLKTYNSCMKDSYNVYFCTVGKKISFCRKKRDN